MDAYDAWMHTTHGRDFSITHNALVSDPRHPAAVCDNVEGMDGRVSRSYRRTPEVVTGLGAQLELVGRLSQGARTWIDRRSLAALAYGHRVAFLEVFCGRMRLTLGVRACGMLAPDGIDKMFGVGRRRWNLRQEVDRSRCERLLKFLDPAITHFAPPCT